MIFNVLNDVIDFFFGSVDVLNNGGLLNDYFGDVGDLGDGLGGSRVGGELLFFVLEFGFGCL